MRTLLDPEVGRKYHLLITLNSKQAASYRFEPIQSDVWFNVPFILIACSDNGGIMHTIIIIILINAQSIKQFSGTLHDQSTEK